MKVKELIEELKKLDQEKEVWGWDGSFHSFPINKVSDKEKCILEP